MPHADILTALPESDVPPITSAKDASLILPVPGHLRALLAPATVILYEWATYRARFPHASRLRVGSTFLDADVIAEQDGHHIGHFQLIFENQLGLTRLVPYRDDTPCGDTIYAEVIAAKFPDADHAVSFLRATLTDLFARGSTLPFVSSATTMRGVREAFDPPNDLFAFHFFRHRGDEVIRGVQAVLGHAHRVLSDEAAMVRIHEVKRIESESLIRMLYGSAGNGTNPSGSPLERLRPERVLQRLPIESHDAPENRFVVTACRGMMASIERLHRTGWFRSEQIPPVERTRLRTVHQHLRQLTTDPRFVMLESSARYPAQSRVLQRRDGYRGITLLWHDFQRTGEPVFDVMEHAIDLRDIATLYEYWLLFDLMDRISTHTGVRPVLIHAFDELGHPTTSFEARVPGAGSLFYQRGFTSPTIYSGILLKPDYVWESADGSRIVMDAKFRIQYPWPKEGDDSPASIDKGRAKTDDIARMHAYRDSIRGVTAAIVLYPGTQSWFRTTTGESRNITIDDLITGNIDGVGAIAMSPLQQRVDEEGIAG